MKYVCLIPVDRVRKTIMVVRADLWHPWAPIRHKIKFFGGKVEADENYDEAIIRELEEELPTLYVEPGTYLNEYINSWKDKANHEHHLFMCYTDLGPVAFQKWKRECNESSPEIYDINHVFIDHDCAPGYTDLINNMITEVRKRIEEQYARRQT